jgi:hypothetical protein
MIRWIALPIIALLGCAASAEMPQSQVARADRDLAAALKGRTPGAPQACISNGFLSNPQVIGDQTILYNEGRTVWRNDLETKCPSLDPSATLVVEINGGQICHHDRIRVIEPGSSIPSMPCMLGKFTPYRK